METDQAPTGAEEYLASRMQDPQYADAWLRERIRLALDGFAGSFCTTDQMVDEVMAVGLDHQELIEDIMGHIWLHARGMEFVRQKMTTEERRAWDAYLAGWKYRMDPPSMKTAGALRRPTRKLTRRTERGSSSTSPTRDAPGCQPKICTSHPRAIPTLPDTASLPIGPLAVLFVAAGVTERVMDRRERKQR